MKIIHRAVVVIGVCFISFGGYAIATRLGASHPPASVSYGTEQADPKAAVFGD